MPKFIRLLALLLLLGLITGGCTIVSPLQTPAATRTESIHTPTSLPAYLTPAINVPTVTPVTPVTPGPANKTVFLIMMENHSWASILGNANAPYINKTLLPMASYAQQYYNPPGNHPSLPNYLWLEAGTNFGIYNDGTPYANHQSTSMHLVTLLNRAGITWKSYQEGIDGTICPLNYQGLYGPKHNPMVYFDDVTGTNNLHSPYCIAHERPYSELATDLQKQTAARYNFITPNVCDDMHSNCSPSYNAVSQGDSWLAQQVPIILNSQAYKNRGVLFITWDESEGNDGPIGLIVLSHNAKGGGYSNSIHYTHSSLLRTLEEIFGVSPLLGDAAHATDLRDLFIAFP